jgi:hypothetical protein
MTDLADFDIFFHYGENDLDLEIESDLMCLVLQNKKSMFYDRSYGGGVNENYPNSLVQAILLPYNIVSSIGRENQKVSDGNNGHPDRRIAVSQAAVKIEQEWNEMRVLIPYIKFVDYNTLQMITVNRGA